MINLKKLSLTFLTLIFTLCLSVQSVNAGNVTINLGHGNTEGSAYDPLAKKFAELAEKLGLDRFASGRLVQEGGVSANR